MFFVSEINLDALVIRVNGVSGGIIDRNREKFYLEKFQVT